MKEKQDDIVYISSEINEIFSATEVKQSFTNELENPIELSISFPIIERLTLSKFVVTIDNKMIISKVLSKNKAEEKYNDAVSSGNVGFISRFEENYKTYSVNIGNLQPKKQIKLTSIFIEMIDTTDLSYQFNIMENYPSFHYNGYEYQNTENKKINAIFKIKTQSKITRLIAPFLNEETKNNCIYKVNYSQDYKKAEIEYKNDKYIFYSNRTEEDKNSFNILFRTENMNKPILYCQYNPELKETAYSINYTYISKYLKEIPILEKPDEDNTISYAAKYEENVTNETPGLFIFLIDQSGSMSGNAIKLVKRSLLLFIQSLPKESYFQLIGFGSDFTKYNEEPVIYNKENVNNIINIINSLEADLGGTNISGPLREIYNSDNSYSKINLSKNILLLTDGVVFDREECINLISSNSNKFRIHSIGIGSSFDKELIEKCGKLGKGTSSFVENVENINSVVIDTLNKGLRPYLTDIKFEFENYKEEISSSIISCNPIDNFVYQNEIMNYSFILPGKKELSNLKIKITGKDPINQIESITNFENIIKLENGDQMSKMIVGKALKNNGELIKDVKKEIEFAKKYQILSKNTALFAEILNEENLQSKLIKVNPVNPVNSFNLNNSANLFNSINCMNETGMQSPFFRIMKNSLNMNNNYNMNNYNNMNNNFNNNKNYYNNNYNKMNKNYNKNKNNYKIYNNMNNFINMNNNYSNNNYNNMNNNHKMDINFNNNNFINNNKNYNNNNYNNMNNNFNNNKNYDNNNYNKMNKNYNKNNNYNFNIYNNMNNNYSNNNYNNMNNNHKMDINFNNNNFINNNKNYSNNNYNNMNNNHNMNNNYNMNNYNSMNKNYNMNYNNSFCCNSNDDSIEFLSIENTLNQKNNSNNGIQIKSKDNQMKQSQIIHQNCNINKMLESTSPKDSINKNSNYSIKNNNISSNIESSLVKRNMNDDINLIMSQDIMDGFWDENIETKKIIDIITFDKFNKIKNKINALNKGENEIKIIYTILVIYYLKTNLSEKLKDYRLVINKANKFLLENGIDYDNIISCIS